MSSKKTPKNKKSIKSLVKKIFTRLFGFEDNIDLTSDSDVLKRKNIVIKNIIFFFNIFFFILMTVYSILSWVSTSWGESHTFMKVNKVINWVVMIATFPTTFLINFFLKKIINKAENDQKVLLHNQQIAMYFSVVYLFIAPLLFYVKINIMWEQNEAFSELYRRTFETFSYLTFYLSLLICSLYNDKKLMINSSLIMFALLTIIHFFVTHNFIYIFRENSRFKLVSIIDISLRYLVFIIYAIVLVAITSRAAFMHRERKEELMRRENVEEDFCQISQNIVAYLKDVPIAIQNEKELNNILTLSNHLSSLIGLNKNEKEQLNSFCLISLQIQEVITALDEVNKNSKQDNNLIGYNELKNLTFLASQIMRRVQLTIKVEQSVRQYFTEINSQVISSLEFSSLVEQVLFICELYYTLRSPQEYKQPLRHVDCVNFIISNFSKHIDSSIKETFISFNDDFKNLYLDF